MPDSILSDHLWRRIEPLLPKAKKSRHRQHAGRKPAEARRVMTGIIFVLKTGLPWQMLPTELASRSASTLWRRLRDRQDAEVWAKLHEELLNGLGRQAASDGSRARRDSISLRAKRGARKPVPP